MLYASDRNAVLLIFQAMDAAGKDDAIKHVMSRVRAGSVTAFPDALRFVQAIRGLGWPMAVALSSKNANGMLKLVRLLDESSLYDAFNANVCGRDLWQVQRDQQDESPATIRTTA